MEHGEYSILAIDPGSASTKIGLFANCTPIQSSTLLHSEAELAQYSNRPVLDQQDFRYEAIENQLNAWNVRVDTLSAVVGRGGLLRPVSSGTFGVNLAMLSELLHARRGEHASNLGAFLAQRIAHRAGVHAFIVDPVSVDEWPSKARYSGSALISRQCLSHALNTKAVARRHARESGRSYESLRLIIAHLGSGISVSAHEEGRMVDVTNSMEEGAFATERVGGMPSMQLMRLCFSGEYSFRDMESLMCRHGGLLSYLGTRDLWDIERRILAGDEYAAEVIDAMVYQIAKDVGSMASVLRGRVDALLFTGGMARSSLLLDRLSAMTGWIAPITTYPGEDELRAMAEGVLRVLRGEECVRELEDAHA